ncbi:MULTISPECIES: site-specific integrase [pseudomallei group]|uniref:site-specific integrase n=1 Tax=pseudomallei group TaxID=111527 RepID=UPI000517B25A|nr:MULTISPECIES: site-specific integrase [pseudomallei group]AIT20297.1 phage integrase family protein [Burkholderia thailandensis E254]MBF3555264.1 site-specific integrase [Burkholderia pseudomallei]MBF3758800.1 site-specific integrase [Burkholderia pseudomallei]MXP99448.1 tyrosine-type recombinase/integrase [Burkholderia pseudomallei]MXQ37308.1 tyrosine-type recombinase/integrase [Burkholderia pseudomallei]
MPTIRKRGDCQFQAIVRRQGFPPQTKTFISRKEAEAWAARIEAEMLAGSFSSPTESSKTPLSELLIRYGREISPEKKGEALELLRIKKLLADPISQVKISALNGVAVAQYRNRRLTGNGQQKPVSGSTVNRELTLLSHVISIASKEWGFHIPVNPVSQIRRPKENRARNRRLHGDEEKRLLTELEPSQRAESGVYQPGGCRNKYVLPVVILAIETAMRRSEILSLRWPDVHLADRYVRLHDTKNGEARDVPLSRRAVQTLSKLSNGPRHSSGRVLPITPEALKKAFVRACERAGIVDLHFHDLRHEATSRIAERLDNVLELSAVTGHKTVQMLKRYYHPRATDLARKLG